MSNRPKSLARLMAAAALATLIVPSLTLADDAHPSVTIEKQPAKPEREVAPDLRRPTTSDSAFIDLPEIKSPRSSESGFQVGTLTCKTDGGTGYGFKSRRDVSCEYKPLAGRHAVDVYLGHLGRVGLDIGTTGPSIMSWGVIAHSQDLRPGDLAGKYRGASASVAAVFGAGANILVGGSNDTISLQPLSVEGQTGFNIAAGYSSLTLNPI